jgi:hypothetical protein
MRNGWFRPSRAVTLTSSKNFHNVSSFAWLKSFRIQLGSGVGGDLVSDIFASQTFPEHLAAPVARRRTPMTRKPSARYASAGRLMFGLENDWVWLSFLAPKDAR